MIAEESLSGLFIEFLKLNHYSRTMKDISGGSGTVGNPSKASAKKGREITDTVLPPLLQILADMRAI